VRQGKEVRGSRGEVEGMNRLNRLYQSRQYSEVEVAQMASATEEEAREELTAYAVAHLQHEVLGILDYGSNVLRAQFIEDLTFAPNVTDTQLMAAMPPRSSRVRPNGQDVVPMSTEEPVPQHVHVHPGSVGLHRGRGGDRDAAWALEFTLDTSPRGCLVTVAASLPGGDPTEELQLFPSGPYVMSQPTMGYPFCVEVDAEMLRMALGRGETTASKILSDARVGDPGLLLVVAVEPLVIAGAAEGGEREHERGGTDPGMTAGNYVELTYIAVDRDATGGRLGMARVVGQRMRAPGGILYDLNDFYGGADVLDGGGGGIGAESRDNDDEAECVVCMTNEPDTACVPCRHLCLCRVCALQLRHSTTKCPICRTPISCLLSIGSSLPPPAAEAPDLAVDPTPA